jgi:hypothetical protein
MGELSVRVILDIAFNRDPRILLSPFGPLEAHLFTMGADRQKSFELLAVVDRFLQGVDPSVQLPSGNDNHSEAENKKNRVLYQEPISFAGHHFEKWRIRKRNAQSA